MVERPRPISAGIAQTQTIKDDAESKTGKSAHWKHPWDLDWSPVRKGRWRQGDVHLRRLVSVHWQSDVPTAGRRQGSEEILFVQKRRGVCCPCLLICNGVCTRPRLTRRRGAQAPGVLCWPRAYAFRRFAPALVTAPMIPFRHRSIFSPGFGRSPRRHESFES
jgi:hypothetical protein